MISECVTHPMRIGLSITLTLALLVLATYCEWKSSPRAIAKNAAPVQLEWNLQQLMAAMKTSLRQQGEHPEDEHASIDELLASNWRSSVADTLKSGQSTGATVMPIELINPLWRCTTPNSHTNIFLIRYDQDLISLLLGSSLEWEEIVAERPQLPVFVACEGLCVPWREQPDLWLSSGHPNREVSMNYNDLTSDTREGKAALITMNLRVMYFDALRDVHEYVDAQVATTAAQ